MFSWLYGIHPWDMERLTMAQLQLFIAWAEKPANYGMGPRA